MSLLQTTWATAKCWRSKPSRNSTIFAVGLALVIGNLPLGAQDKSSDELFDKLSAIESLQADFVQQSVDELGRQEESQEGHIAFQRPGKFLWVKSKPFEQHVLIEGDTMSVFDPDLEQLTHSKMDANNELSLANVLIAPNKDLLERFEIAHTDSEFNLVPLDVNAPFKKLTILFDDDKVSKVDVEDHFNIVNEFKFSNIRINHEIDTDVFEIKVPPGTEVITHGESVDSTQD